MKGKLKSLADYIAHIRSEGFRDVREEKMRTYEGRIDLVFDEGENVVRDGGGRHGGGAREGGEERR